MGLSRNGLFRDQIPDFVQELLPVSTDQGVFFSIRRILQDANYTRYLHLPDNRARKKWSKLPYNFVHKLFWGGHICESFPDPLAEFEDVIVRKTLAAWGRCCGGFRWFRG